MLLGFFLFIGNGKAQFVYKRKINQYVFKTNKELQFDYAKLRDDGNWLVKNGEQSGVVNKQGTVIVPVKYQSVGLFYGGYSIVKKNRRFGVYSREGIRIVPPEYDEIIQERGEMFRVRRGRYFGLYDSWGEQLLTPKYEDIDHYDTGEALVKLHGKWQWTKYGQVLKDREIIFRRPDHYAVLKECVEKPIACTLERIDAFVKEHAVYPEPAKENGIQGRVIAEVIITESGTLKEIRVVRGLGYGCDEETLRLLYIFLSNEWMSARKDEVFVASRILVPVEFKLD